MTKYPREAVVFRVNDVFGACAKIRHGAIVEGVGLATDFEVGGKRMLHAPGYVVVRAVDESDITFDDDQNIEDCAVNLGWFGVPNYHDSIEPLTPAACAMLEIAKRECGL